MGIWLSSIFMGVGLLSFVAAVIALFLLSAQRTALHEEVQRLGGRFSYEIMFIKGITNVRLYLFEGDERDTRLGKTLGAAQGLVPQRRGDGWYLRCVRVKGFPSKPPVWELLFAHGTPVLLPLAPEIVLRSRMGDLERLLEERAKKKEPLPTDETEDALRLVREAMRGRDTAHVEDQVHTK